MTDRIVLTWQRFTLMSEAWEAFREKSCVYVIADPTGRSLYIIGETGQVEGLWGRYKGGTASSMDAALHGSGNLVFVAAVNDDEIRKSVESTLIFAEQPAYNERGKTNPLSSLGVDAVAHGGDVPNFAYRGKQA